MTSSPEAAVLDALDRHRTHALTTTELAARTGLPEPLVHGTATGALRARGLVATHELRTPDPHHPAVTAVVLVEHGPDALTAADQRARACAGAVQRRLLSSHRCL